MRMKKVFEKEKMGLTKFGSGVIIIFVVNDTTL